MGMGRSCPRQPPLGWLSYTLSPRPRGRTWPSRFPSGDPPDGSFPVDKHSPTGGRPRGCTHSLSEQVQLVLLEV